MCGANMPTFTKFKVPHLRYWPVPRKSDIQNPGKSGDDFPHTEVTSPLTKNDNNDITISSKASVTFHKHSSYPHTNLMR